jgi:YhcH/YjgK/YiaL family protein
MVLDTLKNWRKYAWANPRFAVGFEYLEREAKNQPEGTHEIEGKDLYCMIQAYETTPAEGHEFEAHRQYADIQLVLEGEESILWAPQPALTVSKPYKTDIEFYALDSFPAATEVVLTAGCFGVFLPEDAHAPCIAHGAPARVKKAVVKVRL